MLRALFVNPYIYDFTAFDLWLRPLGLLYLASVVEKYTDSDIYWIDTLDRFQPDLVQKSTTDGRGKFHRELVPKPDIYRFVPRNYARYGMPGELFEKRLKGLPPMDVIFVTSLMTYWVDGINFTIDILRHYFPEAKIVLGGLIPSLVPEAILKSQIPADHFVHGPGETAVLKWIGELGGKVGRHPDFSHVNNLPFPALHLLSNTDFLPLITTRGCPFRCTYCASHLLHPRFLERENDQVVAEIQWMKERFSVRHITIFDDALLVNKRNRFLKIFEQVRDSGISFHTPNAVHAREIDEETAEMLFQSGFKTIRLGMESTAENILKSSTNKVSIDDMTAAVRNLEKAGYSRNKIDAYWLFGHPGQRAQDVEDALFFSRDLGIIPHLAYYSPVPGTAETQQLIKEGILSQKDILYQSNKMYYLYEKSGFSRDEIQSIKELSTHITHSLKA